MAITVVASLERVIARYRSDVHGFAAPASAEAIEAVEAHLGQSLPSALRDMLATYNGANLFRGSLRLRSTNELAPASERVPQVILFADGPNQLRWAWARRADGQVVWGLWTDAQLEPHHGTLEGWLAATIAVIEARVSRPEDIETVRTEADPTDPLVGVRLGRRALHAGRPDEAEAALHRATAADPADPVAWMLLGDALAIHDRSSARKAWLTALHRTQLPLPWPGAPCVDPEIVRSLASSFTEPEEFETEVGRVLEHQVSDAASPAEAAVVVALGLALARSLARRGQRTPARETLARLVARCATFTWRGTPWEALLELALLDIGLGRHDEAEAHLRKIRREGPVPLRGRVQLALAAIAVSREEPWAEDILDEAVEAGLDDPDRVRAAALRAERAIRSGRLAEARDQVTTARASARRVGLGATEALVDLIEGDVARQDGDATTARDAWERGLGRLGERGLGDTTGSSDLRALRRSADPELAFRLHGRLGSLARELGDAHEAERRLRTAVAGFGAHELPVREAWALVRLGQLLDEIGSGAPATAPIWQLARNRFMAADLATGIAAIDAIVRNPDHSLDWHLERAATHAMARHDAQRARAPLERADADRPERRLGAHRLAIAGSGSSVVVRLGKVLREGAAASQHGRGRLSDPPILRYVAGVDLLAGHRSYEAAELLRTHLLEQLSDGPAAAALQAAIARSPNAALVDGLLATIEHPSSAPPHAVAAAAEVLGLRREGSAARALVHIATTRGSPVLRKAAIVALGRLGDRSAIPAVASALDDARLSESAAIALLLLGDRHGVDFHARALSEGRTEGAGSHPGEIVGRYGGPEYLPLLKTVATAGDARSFGAIHGLGLLGDPRAAETLLDVLESRDRDTIALAATALTIVTGHHEDLDEAGFRNRWRAWWKAHAERFSPGIRHRDGRIFDLGLLIERLASDDAWVRRTSYDELVILTGVAHPFDADGPWRVQQAHLRAWRTWYHGQRGRFGPGRWFLDGRAIH